MGSKRWGQPPMKNTFNTKNTYENILTGINKEEIFTIASSDSERAA
jgi:hypothetical protein